MKKIFTVLLVFGMLLSLTACGATSAAAPQSAQESTAQTPAPTEERAVETSVPEAKAPAQEQSMEEPAAQPAKSSILVVYFSRTGEQYNVGVIDKGNTSIVADAIVEATGADVFEILPAEDYYPTTYKELTDVAMQEQREKARPAIAGELPDLSQYEVVFIGAPVWWGDWPMILYTFFENTDCSGVKLAPFSTHEGSGLSGFDRSLRSAYPDCEVLKGLAIRGADAQNDPEGVKSKVNSWLAELDF